MPEGRRESRCPRCGELVLPAVRKLCAVCGHDITHAKRVRDDNEYYCHDCWADKLAARGEEPGYVCNTCRSLYPSDQVYQDGDDIICRTCFADRNLDPNALLEVASHAGDDAPVVYAQTELSNAGKSTLPWGLISLAIGLLVALVGVLVFLSLH
ncbi:hypothetical protein [Humisphaera borealis]|uniref:Zinc ribbon domain-containing protein n=1 Tax=Humisphaera borealis TaxID=2807512 RepID=A0A7M2WV18_9BACT|nr:hypothetical protein [Humisphaera borealis]QOV89062.1 hypothetical protein IPV69_23030 [Humisphaera borealis]